MHAMRLMQMNFGLTSAIKLVINSTMVNRETLKTSKSEHIYANGKCTIMSRTTTSLQMIHIQEFFSSLKNNDATLQKTNDQE